MLRSGFGSTARGAAVLKMWVTAVVLWRGDFGSGGTRTRVHGALRAGVERRQAREYHFRLRRPPIYGLKGGSHVCRGATLPVRSQEQRGDQSTNQRGLCSPRSPIPDSKTTSGGILEKARGASLSVFRHRAGRRSRNSGIAASFVEQHLATLLGNPEIIKAKFKRTRIEVGNQSRIDCNETTNFRCTFDSPVTPS